MHACQIELSLQKFHKGSRGFSVPACVQRIAEPKCTRHSMAPAWSCQPALNCPYDPETLRHNSTTAKNQPLLLAPHMLGSSTDGLTQMLATQLRARSGLAAACPVPYRTAVRVFLFVCMLMASTEADWRLQPRSAIGAARLHDQEASFRRRLQQQVRNNCAGIEKQASAHFGLRPKPSQPFWPATILHPTYCCNPPLWCRSWKRALLCSLSRAASCHQRAPATRAA